MPETHGCTKLSPTSCSNQKEQVSLAQDIAAEDEILLRWLEESRMMPATEELASLIGDTWLHLHHKYPDLIEQPRN